jgi:ribosomal protein S18 acetylase RimI-like enzyme
MPSGVSTCCIALRRATVADAARLAAFAATAFRDTFAAENRPDDMAAYLAEAFGEPQQRAELTDPQCTVFLAERDGDIVGYAMLRDGPSPACVHDPSTIEIARLYAGQRWIGAGVGTLLMQRCLVEAASRGRRTIWLGVWERNVRAIGFYQRWHFSVVGSQPFQLGSDRQNDRVMVRRVVLEEERACDTP